MPRIWAFRRWLFTIGNRNFLFFTQKTGLTAIIWDCCGLGTHCHGGSLGSSELEDHSPWAPLTKTFKQQCSLVTYVSDQRLRKAFLLQMSNKALLARLTLRTSLQMYAIQSSLKQFPFVFFTRSVTEPAPQYSITNCMKTNATHL